MEQSNIDPPPPPNFPPPPRQRSRRSRTDQSQQAVHQPQHQQQQQQPLQLQHREQQQPQQDMDSTTASARTVAHGNITPYSPIADNDHAVPTRQREQEEEKTEIHAMELEHHGTLSASHQQQTSCVSPRGAMLPWLSKYPFDDTTTMTADGIMGSFGGGSSTEGLYFGDVMTSFPLAEEDDSIRPNYSTDSAASRFQRFKRNVGATLRRSFSSSRGGTSKQDESDEDSLSDFQEWTPPDSAYGAAFPVCGWVPKHYRRLIEATIIALFVFVLVYVVVTTSIRLSLDQSTDASDNSTSSTRNKFSDDDYYIDYYNDRNNANHDDDEFDYDSAEGGVDDAAAVNDDDAIEEGDDVVNDDQQNDDMDEDGQEENEDGNERLLLRLF